MKSELMQVRVLSKETCLQSLKWGEMHTEETVLWRLVGDKEGKENSQSQQHWTKAEECKAELYLATHNSWSWRSMTDAAVSEGGFGVIFLPLHNSPYAQKGSQGCERLWRDAVILKI